MEDPLPLAKQWVYQYGTCSVSVLYFEDNKPYFITYAPNQRTFAVVSEQILGKHLIICFYE